MGVLHIQREHCALPFCRDCLGSPGSCSPQERFPHKRPVTCGHRPASPDACGRDFRCAVAPLKCGRNLRFPHKRPLPKMPPAGGSVSPTGRKFFQIRAARHTATIHSSLFSIHWSRQGGISRPGKPTPLPGNARELLPAGALRSNVAGTCGSPTNAPSQNAALGFAIGSACAAAFFIGGLSPS